MHHLKKKRLKLGLGAIKLLVWAAYTDKLQSPITASTPLPNPCDPISFSSLSLSLSLPPFYAQTKRI